MRINKLIISSIVISSALSATADAAEFNGTTVRALGMGGSNVAATNSVDATYWNPAAYGFFGLESELDNNGMADKDVGLGINGSLNAALYGSIARNLNALSTMAVPAGNAAAGLNNQEVVDTARFVRDFSSLDAAEGGINVLGDGSVGARVSSFGIGVRQTVDINAGIVFDNFNVGLGGNAVAAFTGGIGATAGSGVLASPGGYFTAPQQDSLRTDLVTKGGYTADEAASMVFGYDAALLNQGAPQTAAEQDANGAALITLATATGDLQQNNTTVTTRGLLLQQVELTYGYAFSEALSVGTVLKYMRAEMVFDSVQAFGANNTFSNTQNAKGGDIDTSFGVDVGMMYRMEGFQFGLSGKNINTPSFTDSTGYVYELKPQAKAGAAWIPTDTFTLEAAYDLTENTGVVESSKNRFWNVGLEWDAMNILALRVGAFENMSADIGVVPTIGLGLNLWAARLDLALAVSNKKELVDGTEEPVYAAASAALAIDF